MIDLKITDAAKYHNDAAKSGNDAVFAVSGYQGTTTFPPMIPLYQNLQSFFETSNILKWTLKEAKSQGMGLLRTFKKFTF